MKLLEKITNILMPMEDVIEEEVVDEELESSVADYQMERKVANGPSVVYAASRSTAAPASHRPQLTVHTTKVPELKMRIYVPTTFDQVPSIADDLKSKQAAIVNYERVEVQEQRRICDFINGVCYVLDGEARRISDTMVLYVPAGVSVSEAETMALEK